MMKFLILVTSCLVYASATQVDITSCVPDGTQAKLSDVTMTVTDCENPERCPLIRNTTHRISISFVSGVDTEGLKMNVYGRVLRVRVPYVRDVNLCTNTTASDGTTCVENSGLKEGKTYTINYPFYIRSQFPEWKVPVEFEVWDKSRMLDCIKMNVEIKCNVVTEANCRREK